MSKKKIIEYWYNMALRDWESVQILFKGKQFIHALFFAHLVIEKLLKAHWIKDNTEDGPPRTHDLEHIYSQTDLEFTSKQTDLIRVMNAWNLEGRYQDYKDKFYKTSTFEYTKTKLKEAEDMKVWLESELQRK